MRHVVIFFGAKIFETGRPWSARHLFLKLMALIITFFYASYLYIKKYADEQIKKENM